MARPTLTATIDGTPVTASLMAASWSLGVTDILADLAPNTAALTFKGQVAAAPRDEIVISSTAGTQWTGTVDTKTETLDNAGLYWTSVTATDLIGALGSAELDYDDGVASTLEFITEIVAPGAGVTIDVVDASVDGLVDLTQWNDPDPTVTFNGSVLAYINACAKASNAIMALMPDGTIHAATRQRLVGMYTSGNPNGDFEVNAAGWAGLNGGSIARSTAEFHGGAACARITSGVTLNGGAYFDFDLTGLARVEQRFIEGQTYRFSLWAQSISGTGTWLLGVASGAGDATTTAITAGGSFVETTTDWTPSATRDAVDLQIVHNAASNAVLAIDDVYVTTAPIELTGTPTSTHPAPVRWTKQTSLDVDINRWISTYTDGSPGTYGNDDAADIAAFGERAWRYDALADPNVTSVTQPYQDWMTYGGSQRPVVTAGEFIVSSDTQTDLMLLSPFQWVDIGDGTEWQVMSVRHDFAWGDLWRVTITADNLLALLG